MTLEEALGLVKTFRDTQGCRPLDLDELDAARKITDFWNKKSLAQKPLETGQSSPAEDSGSPHAAPASEKCKHEWLQTDHSLHCVKCKCLGRYEVVVNGP